MLVANTGLGLIFVVLRAILAYREGWAREEQMEEEPALAAIDGSSFDYYL